MFLTGRRIGSARWGLGRRALMPFSQDRSFSQNSLT
ncbi:hypothetical protein CLOLEP_03716 [[Clostridium] leptum DSM 753]|uniref:Uncharacterized protein n=1 Tax=[Clostridium] leptum DSM 753 TaxID=428125 RepID=A7VYN8_9FIRM|nr:hypothetical protein CLOLEP_03716 [[Clostridium] leptum DSM 753]